VAGSGPNLGELEPSPQRVRAAKLRASGMSFQRVADEIGVHKATIQRWLARAPVRAVARRERAHLITCLEDLLPAAYDALRDGLDEAEDTKQRVVTAGIILTNQARLTQAGIGKGATETRTLHCEHCGDVFAAPCSHVLRAALDEAEAREAGARH